MSDAVLLARLALATGVVLAPGWLIARALGARGVAATLSWSLAVVFTALTVTFLAGGSLTLTLLLVLAAGLVALVSARGAGSARIPGWGRVALAGAVLGILLWHVAGEVGGDGLFHLARVRKLAAIDDLSLDAVNEFADGGLHPGYAFPLWHGFLGLVTKVAMVDPADVVLHESSVLAPIALLVAYEAGWALFRRPALAAAGVGAAVALVAMAPGHGGAYTALALPATASRQILVPAALSLALAAIRLPSRAMLASAAAASLALAVVHPTYALFLWIPFGGFLAVRWAWTRADVREGALALGALLVPGAVFFAWLLPVVKDTASVRPDDAERARALVQYAGQLDVRSPDSFSLAPEVFGRAGAVAVAALVLVPLSGLAARRRWSAYVVGGSLSVLVLMLAAPLFTAFSDAVSLSQARRAAGFLPFAFAFAGGMGVLARIVGPIVVPLALVGGIVCQLAWPGDFGYVLEDGGPAWATWVALAGGGAALMWGFRQRPPLERTAAFASALFLVPVFVHGLFEWSPSPERRPSPLTAGLVGALRSDVPRGAVVFSDLETSYRIGAYAPVYVAAAPPGHVADTKENRPYERREDVRAFFRGGDLAIPRRYGAGWLVIDRSRFELAPDLRVVYRDDRYTLYRLRGEPP